MHDDDGKKKEAELEKTVKWVFDEIAAGNVVMELMLQDQMRKAVQDVLKDIAVNMNALRETLSRDVAEFNYAELGKLSYYTAILLLIVQFKQRDGELPPAKEAGA